MIIFLVIIFYGVLFIIDGYPVLKQCKPAKSIPYIAIFAVAFLLSALNELKVHIPNPSEGIRKVITLIIGG